MDFDFISDEDFRKSLLSDSRELAICAEAGSWKAVYVLAGSIVEALLIEYLVISKIRPNGNDPLQTDLNGAITACEKAGVISKTSVSLCDVIRSYRNLIHPGRAIRLDENVTPEGAQIAINLVALITKEVAARRKGTYGPTAEQILKKLRIDQHALSLFPQLMSEANEHERMKLVNRLIPDNYMVEESDWPDEGILNRLKIGYRLGLDTLPESEQTKAAIRFARVVREDSTEQIQQWSDAFFLATDLRHLQENDVTMITGYFLTRLEQFKEPLTEAFARTLEGIGPFLVDADVDRFGNALIRRVLRENEQGLQRILLRVEGIFDALGDIAKQEMMESRINRWIDTGNEKKYPEGAQQRLEAISSKWITIPF